MIVHAILAALILGQNTSTDPRLAGAFRENKNGWVYAHLHGSPEEIGYQYGYLLAPEIDDANKELHGELSFYGKDWAFYRKAAAEMYWPKVPAEYKAEIKGMSEGLAAKGYRYDTTDLLVQNSWIDLAWYYLPYLQDLEAKG